MKHVLVVVAGLAMLPPFTAPLRAQADAGAEELGARQELQRLNRTLEEIADLLRRHLESQQTHVYLRRLELAHRRLAPLEDELRSTRDEKESVAAELRNLESMLTMAEEEIFREGSALEDDGDPHRMKREIEARIETLKGREWRLSQRVLDLESRLAREREDVQALEEWIDERLGLR